MTLLNQCCFALPIILNRLKQSGILKKHSERKFALEKKTFRKKLGHVGFELGPSG